MDPYLRDDEAERMMLLVNRFPKEDFVTLLDVARPQLTSDLLFQKFLQRMVEDEKEEGASDSDIKAPHLNYNPSVRNEAVKSEEREKENFFFNNQANDLPKNNNPEQLNLIISEPKRKIEELEDLRKAEANVGHSFIIGENFVNQGAIPKRIGTERNLAGRNEFLLEKPSRPLLSPALVAYNSTTKNEKSVSVPNISISLRDEEPSCSFDFLDPNVAKEKTFSIMEKLEIQKYPFVYVVPENPSPKYCLPKGNYFIFSDVNVLLLNPETYAVRHPDAENVIEEKFLEKPKPAARKKLDAPVSEIKGGLSLPSLPPRSASNFRGGDIIKGNHSEVKSKPSALVEPLKTVEEDKNAMSLPLILPHSSSKSERSDIIEMNPEIKAEPFPNNALQSLKKDKKEKNNATTPPLISRKNYHDANDRFLKINALESTISEGISNNGEKKVPKLYGGEKSRFSEILKKFKTAELEQFTDRFEERNRLRRINKNVAKKDGQPNTAASMDPGFWSDELYEDERAIDSIFEEEEMKIQLAEIKNQLSATFPHFDKELLNLIAEEFLFDPDGLSVFIQEEEGRKLKIDQQFALMMEELPDLDPFVLRRKAEEVEGDQDEILKFIEEKRQEKSSEFEEELIHIYSVLPGADPKFLREKYEELGRDPVALYNFVDELIESKDNPQIQEHDTAVRERNDLWNRFVENFKVEDFLMKVPDPEETFCSAKGDNNKINIRLILKFLQVRYPFLPAADLEKRFREQKCNLANTCALLDLQQRPIGIIFASLINEHFSEAFLLEIVFIVRRREICDYLKENASQKLMARNENALLTCPCCYEEELSGTDVTTCPQGHIFCINCIKRFIETQLSDGKTRFECLEEECTTEFLLATLEKVLPPKLYANVLRKKQSAEINEAGIADLESCPSCDFAYIPDPDDKIFKCQNEDCLRETCRKCKEENHFPLRCEEVERPEDVKARAEIEEKMTEALVRTCPSCKKKFVKIDGCNKMTCYCGTTICYLCRKVIPSDYTHFNAEGDTKYHLCPLWTNNDELHVDRVREAGIQTRDQILRQNQDLRLVYDPTKTI